MRGLVDARDELFDARTALFRDELGRRSEPAHVGRAMPTTSAVSCERRRHPMTSYTVYSAAADGFTPIQVWTPKTPRIDYAAA